MDNELWEVLQSFKSALDMCIQRVEQLDKEYEQNNERVQKLESTLYDEIINPTQQYIDDTNRNARFDDFNSKYGEELGSYNDALRSLEGDDFDLTKSAFDKYDSYEGDDKPDEEAFVQTLIEEVSNQLDAIKRGLGIPEDEPIDVEQTEDGETVVTDESGEVVASTDEEPVSIEEETVTEEEPEDDPEEVAAFEEELKNQ